MFVAGLLEREGSAKAEFDATINGTPCRPAEDLSGPPTLPNVARAVSFECPLDALKDGYNDIQIKQKEGPPEQQIVWAEIRIE